METNYTREERYDSERIEKLAYHYREILSLLGEDPQREGHTFAGWSDELPELMPANDITTHATFTANRYLVTFLIDEEGRISAIMPKVKPDTNAAEILAMTEV